MGAFRLHCTSAVMAGHSPSTDGRLSTPYVPAIHAIQPPLSAVRTARIQSSMAGARRKEVSGFSGSDCGGGRARTAGTKPGHDVEEGVCARDSHLTASAVEAAAAPARATRPFAPFEWMVAFRYLRARNAQKSISVIAGFSFLGIVLGVAALIVVMSVMNGFRHDLMEKMIGLNGHMFLQGIDTPLTDYQAVTERVSKVPGVTLALPLVEGQAFATTQFGSAGALVRGIRQQDLERLPGVAGHIIQGSLDGFDAGQGLSGRRQARRASRPQGRRPRDHHRPARRRDAVWRHAADEGLPGRGDLPDRHVDLRQHLHLHAAV